ncbi:MAG: MMPL family transporter [Planctomycetaceae bacterium]|nr:MMPL family transporter [Planctomycetaceae bacterium]
MRGGALSGRKTDGTCLEFLSAPELQRGLRSNFHWPGMVMAATDENAQRLSLVARFLGWLVVAVSARPRFTLWCILSLACAAVGVTVSQLNIKTSRADLIDPAADFAESWRKYTDTFGATSDLIVVVKTKKANQQLIQEVVESLGEKLRREDALFSNVLYRIDQRALRRKGLQFLSQQQLQRTAARVDRYAPVVSNGQWDLLRTDRLVQQLRSNIQRAEKDGTASETLYQSADRFAQSLLRFQQQVANGQTPDQKTFQSPLPDLLSIDATENASDADVAWLINADGNVGLLQAFPIAQSTAVNENSPSIDRLRELIADVRKKFEKMKDEVSISLTGIPVLEHDEMQRTTSDMINASLVAFAFVSVLMFFGFRGMRHPMLAILTLIVSICWTFGAAALTIGHLNILSVSFAVILIGLGIDFSIHFLSRYVALRLELYETPDALRLTAQTVGTGILMSALTTALAFGSAMLTGVPGLAELGLISAMGILLCAAATFLFLPALVALSDQATEIEQLPAPWSTEFYRRKIVAWPVVIIATSVVCIAAFATRAFKYNDGTLKCLVEYDSNLMNLQDNTLESVQAQAALNASTNESLLYAVAVAPSYEEALRLRNEFRKLPSVGRVSEMASLLPPDPSAAQVQLIRQLRDRIYSMPRSTPVIQRPALNAVGREIENLYFVLRDSPNVTGRASAETLDQFLDGLSKMPGDQASDMLNSYQFMVAGALLAELGQVATATTLDPVIPSDLPPELTSRFLRAERVEGRESQSWLVRVYPKGAIWDAEPLEAFVREVRSVSPDISGVPIQNYESASRLHHSYTTVGVYSLAVISLFLLFDFLRPGQKLLTILPPIAVAAFVGYTMFKRSGEVNPHLIVGIAIGLMGFIATVLDSRNLRDTLFALLPPIAGGAILLGVMALCGWDLNPVNLIVLPLVLGIGVDNGIHLLHDYRRQLQRGSVEYSPSADTVNGILLTSMTSIVGFGSLMISAHRGLFSVGVLLATGIAACLYVALIPLPAVLSLVARHQPASLEPVRLRTPQNADGETKAAPQKSRKAA